MHASMQAAANIDDALDHFEEKFGLVMPLTDLISEHAYQLIASRALRASYVGLHDVDGEACHHLAFIGKSADLQLWIHDGDRPVPCKARCARAGGGRQVHLNDVGAIPDGSAA